MALVADTTSPASSAAAPAVAPQRPGVAQRSPADRWMRRLLRLPVDGPSGTAEGARKAFQTSVMVAAVR
ncbi:MAG TPA: hypothetical protein VIT64_16410, partial [Ilumatobacteraceae bacterium]